MKRFFDKFLDTPLDKWARMLIVVAALCLIPSYAAPLWRMTMFAPQYPDGLQLDIYSYKLTGGHDGQDVKEINLLNHYIGMRDLVAEDFTEFKWMPFVIGALALIFFRAALFAKASQLVDVTALFGYFGLFGLWSFAYKLYAYGHTLAPTAAVKVAPFSPPIFGHSKMANFDVYSYPALGTYALAGTVAALGLAMVLTVLSYRRSAR